MGLIFLERLKTKDLTVMKKNKLLIDNLKQKDLEGLIFHSDQEWQYQHQSYQQLWYCSKHV